MVMGWSDMNKEARICSRNYLQGGGVAWIPVVTGQSSTWKTLTRELERLGIRNIVTPHVMEPCWKVHLLPLPPDTIQVRVVQKEDGISWSGGKLQHLCLIG